MTGLTVQGVRVEWTNGPATDNGAYGLYPVGCFDVLIENSVVIGASDAGIYVGQSEQIVVRNNLVQYNVAGIEIENSKYADVYLNRATHNTGGILVFDLPNLPKQGGRQTRVFMNYLDANDTPNFAKAASDTTSRRRSSPTTRRSTASSSFRPARAPPTATPTCSRSRSAR